MRISDAELVWVFCFFRYFCLFSFFSSNSHAICKFHDVSSGDFCLNIHLQAFLFMQALCLLQFWTKQARFLLGHPEGAGSLSIFGLFRFIEDCFSTLPLLRFGFIYHILIPVHSASWKCSLFRRFRFIIYLNCSLFCDSASSYIYNTLPPIAIPFYHISETRALIWRSGSSHILNTAPLSRFRFIMYLQHVPSFADSVHHLS